MKINWSEVSDGEFEQIVAAILRAMLFQNVVVRTGGNDDGWDIDAELPQNTPDERIQIETWRIECKRYKNNPPAEKIRDHYSRMTRTPPLPDHLLFVTSSAFTNPTKEDLREFATADRVRVTFWERQELFSHVSKHMGNANLRGLIAQHLDLTLTLEALDLGCRNQVMTEIERRVGRKYLPELCRRRPIESEIDRFISANPEQAQVRELSEFLTSLRVPELEPKLKEIWHDSIEMISSAKSLQDAGPLMRQILELADEKARNTLKQTIDSLLCLQRNCFLVRDKAGSGKTNLICRQSTGQEEPKTLTMFLSCKFDLPLNRSLQQIVLSSLKIGLEHAQASLGDPTVISEDPNSLLESLILTLQKSDAQLIIFLDGINENRDLTALDEAIIDILSAWNGLPIKFVITCRDIFWSFFSSDQWERFLYNKRVYDLPGFSSDEIDEIIDTYFKAFRIKGALIGTGREKCRHPLLLRFFCEAYRGRNIRAFENLRLKDLFEVYWDRKRREIAEAMSLGRNGGRRVDHFLFSLLSYLSDHCATQIPLGEIADLTGERDLESNRSLYKHLLDQDIILEELPPGDSFDRSYLARRISFVYDEFYDYMMALHHVRTAGWDHLSVKDICLDFVKLVNQSSSFEQLHGVAEYLVLMSEQKQMHRLLCAVLARLGMYDVLCNVLPKLQMDPTQARDVLRTCLLASSTKGSVKTSIGWQPLKEKIERTIVETPSEQLFNALVL
jgi:hypothetical protein